MRLRTINEAIKAIKYDDKDYDTEIKIPGNNRWKGGKVKAKTFNNREDADKWMKKHPGHRIIRGGQATNINGKGYKTYVSPEGRDAYINPPKSLKMASTNLEYNTSMADYDGEIVLKGSDMPYARRKSNVVLKVKTFDSLKAAQKWMEKHPNHRIIGDRSGDGLIKVGRMGQDAQKQNIEK